MVLVKTEKHRATFLEMAASFNDTYVPRGARGPYKNKKA